MAFLPYKKIDKRNAGRTAREEQPQPGPSGLHDAGSRDGHRTTRLLQQILLENYISELQGASEHPQFHPGRGFTRTHTRAAVGGETVEIMDGQRSRQLVSPATLLLQQQQQQQGSLTPQLQSHLPVRFYFPNIQSQNPILQLNTEAGSETMATIALQTTPRTPTVLDLSTHSVRPTSSVPRAITPSLTPGTQYVPLIPEQQLQYNFTNERIRLRMRLPTVLVDPSVPVPVSSSRIRIPTPASTAQPTQYSVEAILQTVPPLASQTSGARPSHFANERAPEQFGSSAAEVSPGSSTTFLEKNLLDFQEIKSRKRPYRKRETPSATSEQGTKKPRMIQTKKATKSLPATPQAFVGQSPRGESRSSNEENPERNRYAPPSVGSSEEGSGTVLKSIPFFEVGPGERIRFICVTCAKRFDELAVLNRHYAKIHRNQLGNPEIKAKIQKQWEMCYPLAQAQTLKDVASKPSEDSSTESSPATSTAG